jgi:hypothetical protein
MIAGSPRPVKTRASHPAFGTGSNQEWSRHLLAAAAWIAVPRAGFHSSISLSRPARPGRGRGPCLRAR